MHIFIGSSVKLPLVFRRLQVELARDMGYTAARYGHVMFPENAYEPALALAELLLEGVGKGKFTCIHFLVLVYVLLMYNFATFAYCSTILPLRCIHDHDASVLSIVATFSMLHMGPILHMR